MAIIINLDVMMAKRKMSLNELSQKVGLTTVNLSILKTGKAKGVRFDTLEAICKSHQPRRRRYREQALVIYRPEGAGLNR